MTASSSRASLAALALALLLAGCRPAEAPIATATAFAPSSMEALQRALSDAGARVREGPRLHSSFGADDARRLWVNDQSLEAHSFSGPEGRRNAQAALVTGGALPAGVNVWAAGQLLVTYRGDDGGTMLLLSALLGDPLTLEDAPDEPYPPGVTAAIRALAERTGVTPGQVDVLSFDSVTWEDSCLQAPRPGETCEPRPVEGWRVQLQVGESMYDVHTDAAGAEVRVR